MFSGSKTTNLAAVCMAARPVPSTGVESVETRITKVKNKNLKHTLYQAPRLQHPCLDLRGSLTHPSGITCGMPPEILNL